MAGKLLDSSIAEVRERADLAHLVAQAGVVLRSNKGLCPFHDERSPSFTVNRSAGRYHCYGCGASGDAIQWIMELESLDFVGAVEHLARLTGVTLRYEDRPGPAGPGRSERERMSETLGAAADWFREQLASPAGLAARAYLTSRGLDGTGAAGFGVGYAPGGWDVAVKALRRKGFSDAEMLAAGLATEGRDGRAIDRFRDRLIFPIKDVSGSKTIGFGARQLSDDDKGPKYLNTPETLLYRKSTVLYGADAARKAIAASGVVTVVEGYTDVIACHLAGVTTAVATCGTALTPDHVTALRRLLGATAQAEIIFAFDGDGAGRKAALAAHTVAGGETIRLSAAVDPGGKDPCEIRQIGGDAAVRKLIEARIPLLEHALRATLQPHDLATPDGRVQAVRAAAPVLAGVADPLLRAEYTRWLAGATGQPEAAVAAVLAGRDNQVNQVNPPPRTVQTARGADCPIPAPAARLADTPQARAERDVIKIAVQSAEHAPRLLDLVEDSDIADLGLRAVLAACRAQLALTPTAGRRAWVAGLLERAVLAGPDVAALAGRAALSPHRSPGGELSVAWVQATAYTVAANALVREQAALRGVRDRARSAGDQARADGAAARLAVIQDDLIAYRALLAAALDQQDMPAGSVGDASRVA